MRNLYVVLKEVYGLMLSGPTLFLSMDGNTLITYKAKIPKRWPEHFNNILNHSSSISNIAIGHLPKVLVNETLDDQPLLLGSQKFNISVPQQQCFWLRLNSSQGLKGKGYSSDWKAPSVVSTYEAKRVNPARIQIFFSIHLYKFKGNHQAYYNHWSIPLFYITSKRLTRILLNHLT